MRSPFSASLLLLLLPSLGEAQERYQNYTFSVAGPPTDTGTPECLATCGDRIKRDSNSCDEYISARNASTVQCLCQKEFYTVGMRDCLIEECDDDDTAERYWDTGVRGECWFFGIVVDDDGVPEEAEDPDESEAGKVGLGSWMGLAVGMAAVAVGLA